MFGDDIFCEEIPALFIGQIILFSCGSLRIGLSGAATEFNWEIGALDATASGI